MIWLLGNSGMLGQEVAELLEKYKMVFWGSDSDIDIRNYEQLKKFSQGKDIKWIINCSGYTNVEQAEIKPERAFSINKDGVRNIALLSLEKNIKLIHISTDYVFDGDLGSSRVAYKEEDEARPLNIYGKSKLAGEKEIEGIHFHYFIIRTGWLYGQGENNFVSKILKLLQEKSELRVVADQWGSPTYTADLAEVILKIIALGSSQFGVYHYTNEGITNWYEFAKEIYEDSKGLGLVDPSKEVRVKAIVSGEYSSLAKRPQWSVLSKEKIKREFHIQIRDWKKALKDFLSLSLTKNC